MAPIEPTRRPIIYTVGHSNVPLEVFLAPLAEHGVGELVDVRSRPFSRFPRFNRDALERSLAEVGIGYRFEGNALGGRPSDPSCYEGGVLPTASADAARQIDYEAVARRPWFCDGVARLLTLARSATIAVMCSEEDPFRCHRHHLIARALLDQAIVLHIRLRDGGALLTASDLPFRTRLV